MLRHSSEVRQSIRHQHRHDQILVLVSPSGHLDLVLPLPIFLGGGLTFSMLEYSGMLHVVEIHYISCFASTRFPSHKQCASLPANGFTGPTQILLIGVSLPLLILLIDSAG